VGTGHAENGKDGGMMGMMGEVKKKEHETKLT
jgi:hypothetical protein